MSKKLQAEAPTRVYKSQSEKHHDLYKLEVAKAAKNVSWTDEPQWEYVEHVHFYHSCDSSGRDQVHSTTVAGHFHEMKVVTPATEDSPAVLEFGPPVKWVQKKTKHGLKKVLAPAQGLDEEGKPVDDHRHPVSYRESKKLIPRKMNAQAAQAVAEIQAKFSQSMPGVQG